MVRMSPHDTYHGGQKRYQANYLGMFQKLLHLCQKLIKLYSLAIILKFWPALVWQRKYNVW
jgi:hypothetical protein